MAPPAPRFMVTDAMILSRDWQRKAGPFYSVHEVAKMFFAMSPSWIRLKLTPDDDHPDTWFVRPDGTPMVFRRRNPDKEDSARVFTLADIEPMAYSLRRFGAIGHTRLRQVVRVVQAEADLYDLFSEPEQDGQAAEQEGS